MARDLHAETDPMSIKNDLLRMNFKIDNAVNILGYQYSIDEKGKHRTSDVKVALRLFEFAFDKNEDVNKIYALKVLCNQKVSIEPVRKRKKNKVEAKINK